MKLYHATTIGGLETLKANSRDREGKPVLYLTDNFPYSLFYIRDREIDFVTCGVREGGTVHYDEKFPNQLEVLYKGMSGWVYEVEVEAEPTKVRGIYVTRGDAKVTDKQYVPDAWQAIRTEIAKGRIQMLYYADTTGEQRALNREGILRLFLSKSCCNIRKEEFLRKYFPEEWEAAQNILA